MEVILLALSGVLVGGIVNVLADELPEGRILRRPRNKDGSLRPVCTWLGLTAQVYEWRRSKPPCPKLNWRYPLTELAVAGLMVMTQLATGDDASPLSPQRIIWQAYAAIFVLLAVVDLERKRVLTVPVLVAAALALVDAAVLPQPGPHLASALAGGLCGGLLFSFAYLGGLGFARLAEGIDTVVFGPGDVYLMALAGLILGFPNVLAAIVLAILLGGGGALLYLALLRIRGRRYQRFTALPYAPYILAAATIVLLFQSDISRLFFG